MRPSDGMIGHPSTTGSRAPLMAAVCAALVIVTFAAFQGVLRNSFVNYDDAAYVAANTHVLKGLSPESIGWAFTTTECSNWHPVTWLSHMLDVSLFGLDPRMHHLTSLLLHALNAVLLFLLLLRMTGALRRCAFVAALFALHPLHVESVAWIAERKDVLSTLFWLLTLAAWLGYLEAKESGTPGGATAVRSPRGAEKTGPRAGKATASGEVGADRAWRTSGSMAGERRSATGSPAAQAPSKTITWYALVLVLFALGLMAKPMLVTLPFTLLLLDFWPLGRWHAAGNAGPGGRRAIPLRGLLLEKGPLFAMSAASCVVTFIAQRRGGALQTLQTIPFAERLANAVVAYAAYLGKTMWPSSLAVFYPYGHPGLATWQVAASALLLAAVSALALWLARKAPFIVFGWLWYLGTLVPVIGLVQVGEQAMADRYTYVPLIGVFIAIVWGVVRVIERTVEPAIGGSVARGPSDRVIASRPIGYAFGVVGVLALVPLFVLTRVQTGYWANDLTLFRHALSVTTDNWMAHNNLGGVFSESGRTGEAISQFEEALRIRPDYAEASYNLGLVMERAGRHAEAIEQYGRALKLRPDYAEAYYNLGNSLLHAGRPAEAVEPYERSLRLKPDDAQAQNNLGIALGRLGRTAEAIEHYNQALRINPNFEPARANLRKAQESQR